MNPLAATVFHQAPRIPVALAVCAALILVLLGIIWKLSRDVRRFRTEGATRKRPEDELSHGWNLLRAITEGTSDAIFAKDCHGRYIMANRAAASLVDKTPEQMIGSTDGDLFCGATTARILEADRSVMETLQTRTDESISTAKNGVTRVYSTTKGPLLDETGAVTGVFGVARDITQGKRDEEKLRESEERCRTIFEQAPLGISEGEIATARLISANQRYADILGYSIDELGEMTFRDYTHPEDLQKDLAQFQRLAAGEIRSYTMEKRYIRKDGAIIWVNLTVSALPSPGENPLTCLAVLDDITERKGAEERLREYERAVEGLEEMIVVVDRDYRYLLANRAYLKYHGMEREQLIGRLVPDLLSRAVFETAVKPRLDECLQGRSIQYEIKYGFEHNGERDMLVSYFPIEGRSGIDRVACVLQDVTDRKRAEEELRRSEEKFKTLFGIAPVGIAFLDSRMNIVDCNQALERMSGLSREDLLGKAWRQRTFLNADRSPRLGRERVTERGVLEKKYVTGIETGAVLENGDIVWAEVTVAPLAIPDASAVVIMHDITERKQAHEQLRVLSRRLFQVQEEERRHLARELHDEIGQALTAVKINLTPPRRGKAANSPMRVQEAIALLDNLIRQVRQISLDLHPSLLDDLGLAPALRSLLEQQTSRAGLRAQFSAADPLEEIGREIQTTAFRIAQEAITNVLRHAHAEFVALFVVTDENELRMKIIDDGRGFDLTSPNGSPAERATFGLTGMKERAALLGGQVSITSAPGQGTTVEVSLPIRENGSA